MRLTGKHETAAIHQFTYGHRGPRRVDPRAAQLRQQRLQGYLEDRRPNSQGDPYQIASQILKTISSFPTAGLASVAA